MNFNDQTRYCHAERVSRSPERSEGEASGSPEAEILRCAQDDKPLPILHGTNHNRPLRMTGLI